MSDVGGAAGDRVRQTVSGAYVPHPPHARAEDCPEEASAQRATHEAMRALGLLVRYDSERREDARRWTVAIHGVGRGDGFTPAEAGEALSREIARLHGEVDMLRPLAAQRDAAHDAADAAEESDQRLRRAMAWIALRVRGGREIVDRAMDMSAHETSCAAHMGRGACDCSVSR